MANGIQGEFNVFYGGAPMLLRYTLGVEKRIKDATGLDILEKIRRNGQSTKITTTDIANVITGCLFTKLSDRFGTTSFATLSQAVLEQMMDDESSFGGEENHLNAIVPQVLDLISVAHFGETVKEVNARMEKEALEESESPEGTKKKPSPSVSETPTSEPGKSESEKNSGISPSTSSDVPPEDTTSEPSPSEGA